MEGDGALLLGARPGEEVSLGGGELDGDVERVAEGDRLGGVAAVRLAHHDGVRRGVRAGEVRHRVVDRQEVLRSVPGREKGLGRYSSMNGRVSVLLAEEWDVVGG